jgi:hypothetical protein
MVEKIQLAVNSYYSQFEQPQEAVPLEETVAAVEESAAGAAVAGEAPAVIPAIMPGLPVEAEDAEYSDAQIGEEDFDNMDLSVQGEGDEAAEDAASSGVKTTGGSAAAATASETAGGKSSTGAGRGKVTGEDEDMS